MSENSVKKGIAWSAIERFSVQGVQFIITLVVANYVLPEEYGLVAMLSIFIAVANSFVDTGFTQALIQKQDRTETDFSTAFYFNIAVGLIAYLILFVSSPYIASFYNEPQLSLLTKFVGLNIVLSSLSVVQRAKFNIILDFKTITRVSMISAILSGVIAIALAMNGAGVWALVFQTLIASALNTALLWIFSKWLPHDKFSIDSFKKLFSFGSKLLVSGLLHTIYINMYTLVIGKFYNATDVGLYNRSSHLAQYPSSNIVMILNRVFFPKMCEKQSNLTEFSDYFHKCLRSTCFIVFPAMIGIASLSEPIIKTLLNDNWLDAIVPLQILSIAYILYPVLFLNNQPLQALGRPDLFLKAEIVKKVIAVLILIGALKYGLWFLCASILLYNICDTAIIIWFSRSLFRTGYLIQIKLLLPIFLASSIMGITLLLFVIYVEIANLLKLVVGVILGVTIYYLFCLLFRVDEINYVNKIVRKILKK